MLRYYYKIRVNNKNLSAFIFGDNWLIGVTSENSAELLKRLKPVLNDNLNEQSIRNVIYGFIEWYKKDYEKNESEPYQLGDDEIVLGIGIIKLNENGITSLFQIGNLGFYLVSDAILEIVDSTIVLKENEKLIIDPKKANIIEKIKVDEEINTSAYSFPFAIIEPIVQEPTFNIYLKKTGSSKLYLKYALIVSMVIGIFTFGWLNFTKLVNLFNRTNDSGKTSTKLNVLDKALDNKSLTDTSHIINISDNINQSNKIQLDEVKDLMNKGLNGQAIQKLDSLEIIVKKMKGKDEENEKEAKDLLIEITLLKRTLDKGVNF